MSGWIDDYMGNKFYLNNRVHRITGLTPRQVSSWTEKGLVIPARPAKKAGTMRWYNYLNLLEFALAKVLLDRVGVQFYTAKSILDGLREDGEINIWASDYNGYCIRFAHKLKSIKNEELGGFSVAFRAGDPQRLGGTVDFQRDLKRNLPENYEGTLFLFLLGEAEGLHEDIRIISPWDETETLQKLKSAPLFPEKWIGKIVIDMGEIKRLVDSGIKTLP